MSSFEERLAAARQRERWVQVYRHQPEVFRAFEDAEDPDGLAAERLRGLAGTDGKRVLELGCGTGWLTRRLAPTAAAYLALDASRAMLDLHGPDTLGVRAPSAGGGSVGCAELGSTGPRDHRGAAGGSGAASPSDGSGAPSPPGVPDRSGAPGAPAPPVTRPQLLHGRAERLPLATASVDRVVASWVLLDLRPALRQAALAEARRVLRPGGSLWLIENHNSSEYQELRDLIDPAGLGEPGPLVEELGLTLREVVQTELRFEDSGVAARVLGAILGASVGEALIRRPRARIGLDLGLLSLTPGA